MCFPVSAAATVPLRRDHRHFEITQTVAGAAILPGLTTPLWTYNGTIPGPTIRSERGRTVKVRHVNRLPVPTVVHLHGRRTRRTATATRSTSSTPRA